jgi:hypothetical protein
MIIKKEKPLIKKKKTIKCSRKKINKKKDEEMTQVSPNIPAKSTICL